MQLRAGATDGFGSKLERLGVEVCSSAAGAGNEVRVVDGAITPDRPKDADEATRERHDGDLLSASLGDGIGPKSEGTRDWRPHDGPRGLDEKGAEIRIALLADRANFPLPTGAVLAWHETEIRFDVVGRAEAIRVVYDAHETRGNDGAYTGCRRE